MEKVTSSACSLNYHTSVFPQPSYFIVQLKCLMCTQNIKKCILIGETGIFVFNCECMLVKNMVTASYHTVTTVWCHCFDCIMCQHFIHHCLQINNVNVNTVSKVNSVLVFL